ncbi:MAG TPA: magnesium/cobalt transporter CorA [Gammaproteobacteria bacterium]|jgi:magnesium transporter|nr:magnesium/cobalt transporter CorA [Gammaproteobacteria bacterium]
MIAGYAPDNGRLRSVPDALESFANLVWVDLVQPTAEEEGAVEQRIGIGIPTREEMQEIEISSRLYVEDGGVFMTATLPARTDSDDLLMGPVTFVLANGKLITVRYHEPRAFKTFPQRAEKTALGCTSGDVVLVNLLEATTDRIADILERSEKEVDDLSRSIFSVQPESAVRPDLRTVLQQIGRKGDLCSHVRDCLLSLQRLAGFLGHVLTQRNVDKELRGRVKTLSRDAESLGDHASFLSQKITFLLDATLGMIAIEQNNIIKIFSIAAGVFLPPTLIASIYGMNFRVMPELQWVYGYPIAGVLMLVSALLPLWYFKRRGWL